MIDEADAAPTQGAQEVYAMLESQLREQQQRLAEVLDQPLLRFNERVNALGLSPVGV